MKQAMLKKMAWAALAIGPISVGGFSAQAAVPITYTGSLVGSYGGDTLVSNYTITTDGTLGSLIGSNIEAFTSNFTLNGILIPADTFTSSESGAGYRLDPGHLSASSSSLIFDYSLGDRRIFLFYGPNESSVRFVDGYLSYLPFNQLGDGQNQTGYTNYVSSAPQVIASVLPVVSPVAPVPEPATWGMMILGMGAVGFAMRRRQKVTTRIAFA